MNKPEKDLDRTKALLLNILRVMFTVNAVDKCDFIYVIFMIQSTLNFSVVA